MRYLILLLLCLFGCEAPLTEEEMAKRYPPIQEPRGPVPLVAPVIPRNGGWSGDNQLGFMQPYGPDNRGRQTILKMDEWGPPEVWTVSLFLRQKLTSFNGFNVKAEIGFGAGGGTQVVTIDWVNGCQISLPMNAINVMAIFSDVDITTEGAGLELGVQLARGARGGQDLPRLTIVENLISSPNITFNIPNFAKNIVVVPSTQFDLAEFITDDLEVNLASGNAGGAHGVAAADGTFAIGGKITVPVVGQARRGSIGYVGAGTAPNITVYAEIDG